MGAQAAVPRSAVRVARMFRLPKLAKAAVAAVGSAALAGVALEEVHASSDRILPEAFPFSHKGFFQAYDMASDRRGHHVYVNVCATCHSMNLLAYRNLVDTCYTEEGYVKCVRKSKFKMGPTTKVRCSIDLRSSRIIGFHHTRTRRKLVSPTMVLTLRIYRSWPKHALGVKITSSLFSQDIARNLLV